MDLTKIYENVTAEDVINKLVAVAGQSTGKFISPATFRHMYRNFCLWRQLFEKGGNCLTKHDLNRMVSFECNIVHYLLERCYWIRYGDSDIVMDLLKELFLLDGHLGKLFDFQQLSVIPRNKVLDSEYGTSLFENTWSDEAFAKEKFLPCQYFLEHANRKKVLFNGERLAEQYFMQSAQNFHRQDYDILFLPPCSRTFRYPQVLTVLLQYGLFATSGPYEDNVGRIVTGIIGVILNSNQNCLTPSIYTLHMIEAGNVLLRAVPSVNINSLLKEQKIKKRDETLKSFVRQLSAPAYLPKLWSRCIDPPDLQHLCRRAIRRSLYNSWNLPKGIAMLPLPDTLKQSIHLQRD